MLVVNRPAGPPGSRPGDDVGAPGRDGEPVVDGERRQHRDPADRPRDRGRAHRSTGTPAAAGGSAPTAPALLDAQGVVGARRPEELGPAVVSCGSGARVPPVLTGRSPSGPRNTGSSSAAVDSGPSPANLVVGDLDDGVHRQSNNARSTAGGSPSGTVPSPTSAAYPNRPGRSSPVRAGRRRRTRRRSCGRAGFCR